MTGHHILPSFDWFLFIAHPLTLGHPDPVARMSLAARVGLAARQDPTPRIHPTLNHTTTGLQAGSSVSLDSHALWLLKVVHPDYAENHK